jgi:hypothetical protein
MAFAVLSRGGCCTRLTWNVDGRPSARHSQPQRGYARPEHSQEEIVLPGAAVSVALRSGGCRYGARIREVAIALWDAAAIHEPIRLLGVSLSGLERAESRQLSLFPDRKERLGATLAAIHDRFGRDAIGRGVAAPHKITQGRQKKRGEP